MLALVPTRSRQLDRTEHLARAIGRLRRAMAARVARVMGARGHALVHWQLISAIATEGLHSQAALAQRVGMDPAGTSRVLAQLEERGLVRRERAESDRRRVSLQLTAQGRRWYERERVCVFTELEPLFAPLTASEAAQLGALVSRLVPHSSGSPSEGSV
jgi:DNA-binding MarR family transcriptional regulator